MSADITWFLSDRHRLEQFLNISDQTLIKIGPNFPNYNCFKNMFFGKMKVSTFICRARVFNNSSHFLFTHDSLQTGGYFTLIFTCYNLRHPRGAPEQMKHSFPYVSIACCSCIFIYLSIYLSIYLYLLSIYL